MSLEVKLISFGSTDPYMLSDYTEKAGSPFASSAHLYD